MPTLITPPAVEPITLDEAKLHLRVTHPSEDALIELLITAAREYVERNTGLSMINQTWELALDAFPASAIQLPGAPLVSVTSVEYLDEAGDPQAVDPALLIVDKASRPGWVTSSAPWPATQADTFNAVRVRYVLGFGTAGESVPADLRAALLLVLGDLFENRQGQDTSQLYENRAVNMLLWQHRKLVP